MLQWQTSFNNTHFEESVEFFRQHVDIKSILLAHQNRERVPEPTTLHFSPSRAHTPVESPPHTTQQPPSKRPRKFVSALDQELCEFVELYPPEERGGYNEVTVAEQSNVNIIGVQPKWRIPFLQHADQIKEYFRAPRNIRIEPVFEPIPRREVWNPPRHQYLCTPPINWPYIASYKGLGWGTTVDILRALQQFFKAKINSADPTVKECAENCRLLGLLLEMKMSFDAVCGDLIFNVNEPTPPETMVRLYYRVIHTSADNIKKFERWIDTQWLRTSLKFFGSIPLDSQVRHQHMLSWYKAVGKKKSQQIGGPSAR